MSIDLYLKNEKVTNELNYLKQFLELNPLYISDVQDAEGHQYVDLVQEGGGVLGIALVGYIYALEEVGIRFFSLGGTSAGAINTAVLACAAKPQERKASILLEEIDQTNLMDFIDGGIDAERLVKSMSEKTSIRYTAFTAMRLIDDFFIQKNLGINRGEVFFDWMQNILEKFNANTTEQLLAKLNDFPEGMIAQLKQKFPDESYENCFQAKLAIIASDLTTHTKVEFPRMSDLYFEEPLQVSPAYLVRASTAIPVFFDPLIVDNIPKGEEQIKKWRGVDKAYYFGDIPEQVTFVDGGIMSNFPIDAFHISTRPPTRPTLGVRLGMDRTTTNNNDSILKIMWNSFSAARQMRDHDVALRNQDFIPLIANIDDAGIDWLNFNLSEEQKAELFARGVTAACAFLKTFDWKAYKERRTALLKIKKDFSLMDIDWEYAKSFFWKRWRS